ncbi:MAG: flagellar hook-basal body complex protein FliE [Oscillospiraceae bacterium]|nr:flagellar hook-basal body complex protein FliE [Oscillospiraceae bacterium]
MNTNFQRISPLWETFPVRQTEAVQRPKASEGSVFKDVFQAVIDNVRESEDDVAKKEYLLSTGQLDNPVELSIAASKAEASMALFVQLRDKALSAYSELSRISL